MISTVVTLIPHGSVWLSMMRWRASLRCSRSVSSVSRSTPPSTDRSVVCAIWSVAECTFSTSVTALVESTTR